MYILVSASVSTVVAVSMCTSHMSSALVTDAPTLALAQVPEWLKSVKLHHRMSIIRLCIALVQQHQMCMLADVCGFIKPPESHDKWQVRFHGAFSILQNTPGLKEKD